MGHEKEEVYQRLAQETEALFELESDFLANTANLSAILFRGLPEVHWAGFYFFRDAQLILGPFQGSPACTRIALGRGVCGKAAQSRSPIIVPRVDQFPGYIACDRACQSEIVLPLLKEGRLEGVLDLDSHLPARFDEQDRKGLEQLISILLESSDPPGFKKRVERTEEKVERTED